MSISTHIHFCNVNDSKYLQAIGTPDGLAEWENEYGDIENNPGATIEEGADSAITDTDDEYGGWIVDLSKVPKDATHIKITRY